MLRQSRTALAALALALAATACDSDDDDDNGNGNGNGTGPSLNREFTQIERLGNPLVNEVFFMKRDHGLHNTISPSQDDAQGTDDRIRTFIATVAGRNATVQNTVASVLVPDMLMVFPNRAANTAGWLSWALANGYGGRKLSDDVVDAGLSAVFGSLLDASNTSPGLASDNVGANDKPFATTFPYLAAPTP